MAPTTDSVEAFIEAEAKKAQSPLLKGNHASYRIYSDPGVFELEKERLFYRDWLCIGRVEQIASPGDYMSIKVFDESIIVARNENDEIHAFSNYCLHRGAEIAKAGIGHASEFQCPYHSWLYSLDGKLLGAPHMRESEGFEPRKCALPRVALETWGGFIFVNLSAEPKPFLDSIGTFAEEFDFLRLADCVLFDRIEFRLQCNWKFVVENLFDIYHVTVIHKNTFGKFRDTIDYFQDVPGQKSLFGFYKAAPSVYGGESLFGNMPWLADKPREFACSGFQPPNMQMFARCDGALVHCIWPVSHEETRMFSYHLFPRAFTEDPKYEEKARRYTDFTREIIGEDEEMIVSLQRAARSRLYQSGRLSRLEHGVYNVLGNYLERMTGSDQ